MKRLLVLDRDYPFKDIRNKNIEIIVVALRVNLKKQLLEAGYNVVACFDEEYNKLPIADIPKNYLKHSWDSDRFLKRYAYEKRLEILGKEISFWKNVFDKYKPDAILNEVVTMEFMEVMYNEAKIKNIKYFCPCPSFFLPLTFWLKTPFDTYVPSAVWDNVLPNEFDYERARKLIADNSNRYLRPSYVPAQTPSLVKDTIRGFENFKNCLIEIIKNKIAGTFYYENSLEYVYDSLKICSNRLMHSHDSIKWDSNTEYILYPLHFEPEAVVEYWGYYFNDQTRIIGQIAHSLSTNQILIIKEHPQQIGVLLTKKYRTLKQRFCNIKFVSGDVSSFEICKKVSSVITLNGTIGMEFWMRQKPVIVLGNVFFRDFPGITKVQSVEQLQNVIRNHKYDVADLKTIELYVAKVYHYFFEMEFRAFIKNDEIAVLSDKIEEKMKEL